uniref:Pentacotripeptide-repeat region of PRORP domain-containing protein n=2 Tax=Nymphaea colorata TaxID=210225 RepID=A0A5K0VFT0_9MAGN
MGCLIQGTLIHAHVIKYGFEKSSHVATLLMDMYGKCGNVEDASQVFDLSPCKDAVSWSTILSIFANLGNGHKAVELFDEMMAAGLPFDSVSLMEYLSLCSRLGALSQGKCLHGLMTKIGLETDTPVGTALIDMYAKCGNLSSARSFFNQMNIKDVICWNAMITGCGTNGCGDEAVGLFWKMNSLGFQPNNSTFLSILSACSHAGLVKHGFQIFEHMTDETTLVPDMQHFACLIDLLARAGHLHAAYQLVKSLSLEQDVGVLGALLGACKIYGEIAIGAEIARKFFELDLSDAGCYVLLSNWYAGLKDWNRVEMVQDLLRLKGLKKEPGCSMIDIGGSFHTFVFEDT